MRAFARVLAVALVAVTAACGGNDGINDPRENAAGLYALKTVNGAPLPIVVLEEPEYKLEVTAASYILTGFGTFTNSITFKQTESGVVSTGTETLSGSYTLAGTAITLTHSDGEVMTGVLSGNNLQFSADGQTAVFTK